MKAFLMYKDRDFDPGQLIVRREKKRGIAGKANRFQAYKMNCLGTKMRCGRISD